MKYKIKQGMGLPLKQVIKASRKAVKNQINTTGVKKPPTQKHLINTAIKAAKKRISENKNGKHYLKKPRVIPLPKRGGFIPLRPILGALAADGSLAGGVTTAAKNIYEMVKSKEPTTNPDGGRFR
ncbi:unnamed protein product [Arctia plantaginis]|uniref:Uncharacterized protein n=1 Tax=Arctia plantaginis TaxID=874455 RepID=A0A8S1AIT1_ARCPL|nr:unnamed protein product [Arctia plantaginis]CAB3249192.1 unnamed protein product [Arctia plantaginis]